MTTTPDATVQQLGWHIANNILQNPAAYHDVRRLQWPDCYATFLQTFASFCYILCFVGGPLYMRVPIIHLISSDWLQLVWPHFVWCAVIGRSHGELGRFTAHDSVRRGCDQSQRTQFRCPSDANIGLLFRVKLVWFCLTASLLNMDWFLVKFRHALPYAMRPVIITLSHGRCAKYCDE